MKTAANTDEKYMREALKEAAAALERGEVPIGAVVVETARGRIIGRGHNLTETLTDATAHAEMQAITAASAALGGKYLDGCTLYVTVEPCPMCAGAMAWAQLGRLVYGAADPKRGFMRFGTAMLHPRTAVDAGVSAEECGTLVSGFFKKLRD
ncbi:MAG: nucleoside deaminase [Alistipes sp.]|jgi:tRNA(adenine34) deaminase|nr:nucleoside deaminase [Alistipes sp.]